MSKAKLVRGKLTVAERADVHHIAPSNRLEIEMVKGGNIDVSYLRDLDYCELLVRELNIYLRGQRAARVVANTVLNYLRYVASVQGAVSSHSLDGYKVFLDGRSDIDLSTKSQLFGSAKSYIGRLMDAGILEYSPLAKNFSKGHVNAKSTFVDAVRYDLPGIMSGRQGEIDRLVSRGLGLKQGELEALAFCISCMSALRSFAEEKAKESIADWQFVEGVVGGLGSEDLVKLKGRRFLDDPDRSAEKAISILYANHGWALPPDVDEWPEGISYWMRKRGGWQVSRLKAAFFPNLVALGPFAVLALADSRLCPNVDSVFFYAYLDCCMPSAERGMVDVYFQKIRGASAPKSLPEDDPLVTSLRALSNVVRSRLPEMPGGDEILRQEYVSCFLHYWTLDVDGERVSFIRPPDPSSTSFIVRRFIKAAAKVHPILEPLIPVISGESFRPTHAYMKKLLGDSIYKIKNDLNHSHISTTDGYVDRVEIRTVLNRKHQDFQKFIVAESVEHVKRTGSGYICNSASIEEKNCAELLACTDCEAKRIIWGDEVLVAEWLAWEKAILEAKDRLIFENIERWRGYWEPRLVEYQTLIGKTAKKTIRAARLILDDVVVPCIN
ncbi:MAG TPA: hypothetical protein DIW43_11205 [Spongiibacteraceae bacterium]|nr:hypothetical protein [Spongiibacteraceae bacterium]HCS28013.1 hypothetical protein [Spongiibacteraceae bacterium]|tara:strand:- start:3541 stop:5370 length:1830 start_codon:yes stop_codon:yes gene_type:complete